MPVLGIATAQAASQGCQTARAGAFSLSAPANADAGNILNLAFDSGDTLTFVTGGNPVTTQIEVNGAAVPMAGNTAQFVFSSSGTFTVEVYIASQVAVPSTLSANCQATTGEKSDAIKTLTDALRIVDLNQQRSMLQTIQNSFLRGATVGLFIRQLEARRSQLTAQGNSLKQGQTSLSIAQSKREILLRGLLAQQALEKQKIEQHKTWIATKSAELNKFRQRVLNGRIQGQITRLRITIDFQRVDRLILELEKKPFDEFVARNKARPGSSNPGGKIVRAAVKIKQGQSRQIARKINAIDVKVADLKQRIARYESALANNGQLAPEWKKARLAASKLAGEIQGLTGEVSSRATLLAELESAEPGLRRQVIPPETMKSLQSTVNKALAGTGYSIDLRKRAGSAVGVSKMFKNLARAVGLINGAKQRIINEKRLQFNNQIEFINNSSKMIGEYQTASAPMVKAISKLQSSQNSLRNNQPVLDKKIARIRGLMNSTASGLAGNQTQIQNIDQEVSRIDVQLNALRSRMGAPTQFAGTNQQSIANLTASQNQLLYPYASPGLDVPTPGKFSLFFDLNSAQRRVKEDMKFLQDGNSISSLGVLGPDSQLKPIFNIWASTDYSKVEGNQIGADRNGDSYSLATGIYFAPSPKFMVGALYRFRRAGSTSLAQASEVDVVGHGIGLHSTFVISPSLSLSGHALYERSNTDSITGITRGSFDTDQLTLSGQLQGSFTNGPMWLAPSVGVVYSHADQESYLDSLGVLIPGRVSRHGQVTFGPTLGYRKWFENEPIKFIEPSFSVTGVWNFLNGGNTTLASGTIIEQDNVAAQLSLGLTMLFSNNAQLSLNAGYSGFGASEIETYSVSGKISFPIGGK